MRIGIYGICGKMGKRIAALAMEEGDMEIVSVIEIEGHPMVGKDMGEVLGTDSTGVRVLASAEGAKGDIDCMIDFTLPDATVEHVKVCADAGIPMVIGTTGLDAKAEEAIKKASEKIPIVFSPNMSVAMNVLFNLVSDASRVLGEDFSIKVDETHHVHKKDSPSGTAKMILKVIKGSCGRDVPVEAFREGEVIGNHGINFDSEYETLEIRHDAKTRDVFVAGALKAARFVAGKAPGLYSMADVLGLN